MFEDRTERCEAGQVALLRNGEAYSGRKIGHCDNSFLVIDFLSLPPHSFVDFPLPTVISPGLPLETERKMRDMEMLFCSGEIDKKLRVRAMLIELIADLYRDSFQKKELGADDERARAFARFFEAHYAEDSLTIAMAAEAFSLSTVHFRRLFTSAFGMTPSEMRKQGIKI